MGMCNHDGYCVPPFWDSARLVRPTRAIGPVREITGDRSCATTLSRAETTLCRCLSRHPPPAPAPSTTPRLFATRRPFSQSAALSLKTSKELIGYIPASLSSQYHCIPLQVAQSSFFSPAPASLSMSSPKGQQPSAGGGETQQTLTAEEQQQPPALTGGELQPPTTDTQQPPAAVDQPPPIAVREVSNAALSDAGYALTHLGPR
jgi:hypothetical protein